MWLADVTTFFDMFNRIQALDISAPTHEVSAPKNDMEYLNRIANFATSVNST